MSGIASFIAGLGTGYVQASRYHDEQERLKKKDAMDKETHDAQMSAAADASTERKQKLANEQALRDAAAPATVETGANGMTKPTTADNSDVGQPGEPGAEAGGLVTGSLVNGKPSSDPAASAAAYNDPAARDTRMVGAMQQTGDYRGAAALKTSNLQAQAAQQTLADAAFKRQLGAAMLGGHAGLAQFITGSDSGPMAGKNVQAVPSTDGKSVTYNVVNSDGTLTPTQFTFSNDADGVRQAAFLLDKNITPEHRMDFALKQAEAQSKIAEATSHGKLYEAAAGLSDTKAAAGGFAPKRADNFEPKEWDKMVTPDKAVVSLPDALGKDAPSAELTAAHLSYFNAARNMGTMSPAEAKEYAASAVLGLRNDAMDRVQKAKEADPKSKLTVQQAVRQIAQEAQTRQRAAAAASKAPATATPDEAAMRSQVTGDMGADPATIQREIVQSTADLKKVPDQASRDMLTQHIADMQGQLARVSAGANAAAPPAAPMAAQGIAPPAPPPAPPPAKMAAQGVPAQPPMTVEASAQRLAAATAALQALRATAPGLMRGQEARTAYMAKLAQAQAAVDQAQSAANQAQAQAQAVQAAARRSAFAQGQVDGTGPALARVAQ